MSSILYLEDDRDLAKAIQQKLKDKYVIDLAFSATEGFEKLEENEYDLLIVDYFLNQELGADVCRKVRQNNLLIPILFLSQNSLKKDIVEMLEVGADDYLTKPFDYGELSARINALLRRRGNSTVPVLKVGNLKLDQTSHKLISKQKSLQLSRQEYLLLEYLMMHKNQIVSRWRLYEHAWKTDDIDNSNTITSHISKLRKKVKSTFKLGLITSVYGLGYMIEDK